VLLANCHGCHNEETIEGGYRVDSFTELQKPGDSKRLLWKGVSIEESELFRRLTTDDVDERMPSQGEPLSSATIDLFRKWIKQGAKYDAEDPGASLAAILPVTRHPDPPATYRFTIPITALAFRRDGRELLVGGYHEILVWDLDNNKLLRRIPQTGQRIYGIQLDEQANRIYVASGTPGRLGEVRVLDAETGSLLGVPLTTTEVVLDVALAPNNQLLAAASGDRKLHLIDLRQNRVTQSIGSHSDWVHAVDWSEDGSRLASASRDKTAKVFDVASGRPIATFAEHGQDVVDVSFVRGDNSKLVSCDATGKTHIWNAADGKKAQEVPTHGKQAFRLLASSRGFWLAGSDERVRLFSWNGDEELTSLGKHVDSVLSLALDQNSKRLATGSLDGRVRLFNLEDGTLLTEFTAIPYQ